LVSSPQTTGVVCHNFEVSETSHYNLHSQNVEPATAKANQVEIRRHLDFDYFIVFIFNDFTIVVLAYSAELFKFLIYLFRGKSPFFRLIDSAIPYDVRLSGLRFLDQLFGLIWTTLRRLCFVDLVNF
jgi:hypothetical protein